MIRIESLVRHGGRLEPAVDFVGPFDDPNYIYGVLVLEVNGVPIIMPEDEDLVDQLWEYLVDIVLIEGVLQGRTGRCFFPDQPVELLIHPQGDGQVQVQLRYADVNRTASADLQELLHAIEEAGRVFWSAMIRAHRGKKRRKWAEERLADLARLGRPVTRV
jgi:hypothetical protein